MDQRAIQFNEAELKRCQPVVVVVIHGGHQSVDSLITLLLPKLIASSITAKTAFGQQLFFPPAIDAFGHQIGALGLSQTFEQGIAVVLGTDQITQNKQIGNTTLML